MPGSRSGDERVNVFDVGERYCFKHYFDGEAVFAELEPYYNDQAYRFEVPPDEFEDLREFLRGHGYELRVVDDPDDFAVAVEQYSAHPENVFEESVLQRSTGGYNCFLMTSQMAVAGACGEGAVRIGEVPVESPF
ncbi:hypothetical protein BRD00_10655 [Halobacteriales archaeon QS_8_69_26]|nr:MAG: hypothetical protein BRD00_10655 [Halobacteriales archaeon QS_8_69_26]